MRMTAPKRTRNLQRSLGKSSMPVFMAMSAILSLFAPANGSTTKTIGPMPLPHRQGYQRSVQRATKKTSIDAQVQRVGKRLDLSELQRLDLRKILENQQAQANRLWNDQKIEPVERMTQLRALHENTLKQFRAVLSREQRTKYDDLLQQQSRQSAVARP